MRPLTIPHFLFRREKGSEKACGRTRFGQIPLIAHLENGARDTRSVGAWWSVLCLASCQRAPDPFPKRAGDLSALRMAAVVSGLAPLFVRTAESGVACFERGNFCLRLYIPAVKTTIQVSLAPCWWGKAV